MFRVAVIGSGFAGLSSACFLAQAGFDVTVFEKNDSAGGRARQFKAAGFTFDMGPTWYWMPDVFERFFAAFGKKPSDYYTLQRLDPSYRIVYTQHDYLDIPADRDELKAMFERLEPGSGKALEQFLKEGKYKYDLGMKEMVYQPGLSIAEFFDAKVMKGVFRLHVFKSISDYIRTFFKHPLLIRLLEFPVLFLGATPEKTPALYSLMNYADIALGTWYPIGGMHRIIEGMVSLAKSLGVKFEFNSTVENFEMTHTRIESLQVNGNNLAFDYVVAGADYHHVEQQLLPESFRRYSKKYWDSRTLAPSCLMFYLGLNKKIKGLLHHTLVFNENFKRHAEEIYDDPQWPSAPQFYISCSSQTDESTAPAGHENIVLLIPVAAGLTDSEEIREKYFNMIINRLEQLTGESIKPNIVFKKSYAHQDFLNDYNAYKGNAYGLANTLAQTALLKPSIINKKVSNLFYTGQLTVPGPGVPPAIISGQVAAELLIKKHQTSNLALHERSL